MVQLKWYKENAENFSIIFGKHFKHDFSTFITKKEELNIPDDFIENEVFKYYQKRSNATYNDIKSLYDFIYRMHNDHMYKIDADQLLNIYIKSKEIFTDKEKEKIIVMTNLISWVNGKAIEEKNFHKLLDKNKLVYNKDLFSALNKNYEEIALKYALKFENTDNFNDLFRMMSWKSIMQYLIYTKYQTRLINKIDNSKLDFTEEDCSNKALNILIQNTMNASIIKKVMLFQDVTLLNKEEIIKRIFSESIFQKKFTKIEISKFLFGDSEFVKSWVVNGQDEITTLELINKYKAGLQLLFNNLPQSFKKRGTHKFILRKKFNIWLN